MDTDNIFFRDSYVKKRRHYLIYLLIMSILVTMHSLISHLTFFGGGNSKR